MIQALILVAVAILVGLDQLTKALITANLQLGDSIPLIKGVFELEYVQNTGASFGILKGHRWIFIAVTALVLVFLLVVLMSGKFKRYRLFNVASTLIVAGGIGNMIDRIAQGYVVDFLSFKLIHFPVFNVADCCVVIGAALLLIYFFFFYERDREKADPTPAEAMAAPPHDELPEEAAAQPTVSEEQPETQTDEAAGENHGNEDRDTDIGPDWE